MNDRRRGVDDIGPSSSGLRITPASTRPPAADPPSTGEFVRPVARRGGLNVVAAPPAAPVATTPPISPAAHTATAPPMAPAARVASSPPAPARTRAPVVAESSVGDLELTPLEPTMPGVPPPVAAAPAAPVLTPAPSMSADLAAGLAALKRARPTTSSPDDGTPARGAPLPASTPASLPPAAAVDVTPSIESLMPAQLLAAVRAHGGLASDEGTNVPTPPTTTLRMPQLPRRTVVAAFGVVALVAIIGAGGYLALAPPAHAAPALPKDAVECVDVVVRDSDLVCRARASSLSVLLPRERRERIEATRAVAKAAGLQRIVFDDDGRVWRVESVESVGGG